MQDFDSNLGDSWILKHFFETVFQITSLQLRILLAINNAPYKD